jgi:hypothetical protein
MSFINIDGIACNGDSSVKVVQVGKSCAGAYEKYGAEQDGRVKMGSRQCINKSSC